MFRLLYDELGDHVHTKNVNYEITVVILPRVLCSTYMSMMM